MTSQGSSVLDWVSIAGLFLGPIFGGLIAYGVSESRARATMHRNQRLWIFRTLLATRSESLNPDRLRALALIDLDFRDYKSVTAAWKTYYDSLNNPMYANGANDGSNVWKRNERAMLSEIAQAMGYGDAIKYEQLERQYSPEGPASASLMALWAAKEWLRVLLATERIGEPRERNVEYPEVLMNLLKMPGAIPPVVAPKPPNPPPPAKA